jgi:hypothetical protein
MNTTESQAIALSKIQKLLALAADPGSADGEAENATRMATKLMVKYGIDEAMLNWELGRDSVRVGRANARHMCNVASTGKPMHFCGFVAIGVAEFTGTVVEMLNRISIHSGTSDSVFRFSGEITDVKLAVWLCETLLAQAQREWRRSETESSKVAWLNGWGVAVQARLYKMAEFKSQEEGAMKLSDNNALVVLDQKCALIKEKFGEQAKLKSNAKSSSDGWVAGMNTSIPTNALSNKEPSAPQLS